MIYFRIRGEDIEQVYVNIEIVFLRTVAVRDGGIGIDGRYSQRLEKRKQYDR